MCADLKHQHCRPGSRHENFMKEHCRKTCGFTCDKNPGTSPDPPSNIIRTQGLDTS